MADTEKPLPPPAGTPPPHSQASVSFPDYSTKVPSNPAPTLLPIPVFIQSRHWSGKTQRRRHSHSPTVNRTPMANSSPFMPAPTPVTPPPMQVATAVTPPSIPPSIPPSSAASPVMTPTANKEDIALAHCLKLLLSLSYDGSHCIRGFLEIFDEVAVQAKALYPGLSDKIIKASLFATLKAPPCGEDGQPLFRDARKWVAQQPHESLSSYTELRDKLLAEFRLN